MKLRVKLQKSLSRLSCLLGFKQGMDKARAGTYFRRRLTVTAWKGRLPPVYRADSWVKYDLCIQIMLIFWVWLLSLKGLILPQGPDNLHPRHRSIYQSMLVSNEIPGVWSLTSATHTWRDTSGRSCPISAAVVFCIVGVGGGMDADMIRKCNQRIHPDYEFTKAYIGMDEKFK